MSRYITNIFIIHFSLSQSAKLMAFGFYYDVLYIFLSSDHLTSDKISGECIITFLNYTSRKGCGLFLLQPGNTDAVSANADSSTPATAPLARWW